MITDRASLHLEPEDWPPIDHARGVPTGLQCHCHITESHTEAGEDGEELTVVDAFEVLSIDYTYEGEKDVICES